jgi:hypothetical protein
MEGGHFNCSARTSIHVVALRRWVDQIFSACGRQALPAS